MPDAGWYDDPLGEGELRFWDGADWTVDVRGAKPPAVTPDEPRSLFGTLGVAILALAVVLVALLIAASLGGGARPTLGKVETPPTSTAGR